MIDIAIWASDISTFLIVVLSLFCIYHYKNTKAKSIQKLFHYIFFLSFIEIAATIVASYYKENNLPLLHLLTLGEFILLSLFYRDIIAKPNLKSIRFLIFVTFICLLIIGNTIFLQDIYIYNSYAKSLVQGIVIAYTIIYFYNLTVHIEGEIYQNNQIIDSNHIKEAIHININSQNQKSLRLINSSILLYYSGSLFIFMFGNHYQQNEDIYLMFWVFNAALLLVFYLLILIGIWKTVYQAQKYST